MAGQEKSVSPTGKGIRIMFEYADIKGKWIPDQGDGTYRNPVIFADYSDPDVVRYKGVYYLIASSFNLTPVIPVLRSFDLINWRICSYISDNLPLEGYETPQHSRGIWAPSLLEHEGCLYMYVFTPDEGLFVSTSRDPEKEWSPLKKICSSRGWIDCTVFWDEDGECYLVHGYAASRAGFNSVLTLRRMSRDGMSLKDQEQIDIFDARGRHETLEGPKLFKRNGWYYIIAPAGGIEHGYQVMLRSKCIEGPYEDRIILHELEGGTINGPRQGNIVADDEGEEWFLHFRDMESYGRVICLEPVSWQEDGWAVFGVDVNQDGIGEPVRTFRKPYIKGEYPIEVPQTDDDFTGEGPGLIWQWNANHEKSWYTTREHPGYLRLRALPPEEGGCLFDQRNLLACKFPSPNFTAEVTVSLPAGNERVGVRAGLMAVGNNYGFLELTGGPEGCRISWGRGAVQAEERWEKTIGSIPAGGRRQIRLRLNVRFNALCSFQYEGEDGSFHTAGEEYQTGRDTWMGAKIGLYCVQTGDETEAGYADFSGFKILD